MSPKSVYRCQNRPRLAPVNSVASDDKASLLENRITILETVVQNLQNQVLQLIDNNRRRQDHEEVINQSK